MLVLMTAHARAEGPWCITLAAEPAVQRVGKGSDFSVGAASQLDTAYRVADSYGFGLHLGMSYVRAHDYAGNDATYAPLEMGVSAQVVISNRVLIVPWLGALELRNGAPATGIELGFDLASHGHEHLTALATFTRSFTDYSDSYTAIGVGIAYRNW